jgi:hypothetical protein
MVGTTLENRLLLVTFNCTRALEEAWLPVGKRIIESIQLPK